MRQKLWGVMLPMLAGFVGGICSQPMAVEAQKLAARLKAESITAEFMRVVGADTVSAGDDRTIWIGDGSGDSATTCLTQRKR